MIVASENRMSEQILSCRDSSCSEIDKAVLGFEWREGFGVGLHSHTLLYDGCEGLRYVFRRYSTSRHIQPIYLRRILYD